MSDSTGSWVVRFGREELVIRQRYEVVSIVNDFLIAVWFIIGSVLFFNESTTVAGTWLFLIGSAQLAVRPIIRLSRHVHLRKLPTRTSTSGAQDF